MIISDLQLFSEMEINCNFHNFVTDSGVRAVKSAQFFFYLKLIQFLTTSNLENLQVDLDMHVCHGMSYLTD